MIHSDIIRFTNWKGEPDRKTKRGFAAKREALDWERDFLTQSSGNLEMTFEAFYELYKKNMKERIKLSILTAEMNYETGGSPCMLYKMALLSRTLPEKNEVNSRGRRSAGRILKNTDNAEKE